MDCDYTLPRSLNIVRTEPPLIASVACFTVVPHRTALKTHQSNKPARLQTRLSLAPYEGRTHIPTRTTRLSAIMGTSNVLNIPPLSQNQGPPRAAKCSLASHP